MPSNWRKFQTLHLSEHHVFVGIRLDKMSRRGRALKKWRDWFFGVQIGVTVVVRGHVNREAIAHRGAIACLIREQILIQNLRIPEETKYRWNASRAGRNVDIETDRRIKRGRRLDRTRDRTPQRLVVVWRPDHATAGHRSEAIVVIVFESRAERMALARKSHR